jgi:hypothetical protein
MQAGILLALAFVIVCWILVIGHQLEWGLLSDPDRYAVLQGFMAFAYVCAGLSVCAVVVSTVALFKK